MIDWDVAISTGVRFARQGPQVSLTDARAVVAELRGLTTVVQQPVREADLRSLPGEADAGGDRHVPVDHLCAAHSPTVRAR